MNVSNRRLHAGQRVFAAQKLFIPFTDYEKDKCWVHPATLQAMQEAERAFSDRDYDKAEEAWIAKMRERETVT